MLNSVRDGAMTDERLGKMLRGLSGSSILARRCAAGIEFATDRSRALRQPAILSACQDNHYAPTGDTTKARCMATTSSSLEYAMDSTTMRIRVLLSIQRALLGQIGTAVRRIVCSWTETEIHVRVVVDGEIGEDDVEAMEEAKTEVIADFPNTAVFFKLERCDGPTRMQHERHEVAVFQRLEQ
jgi:hypothetical protein